MTETRSSFSNKTHVLSSDKITVIELTLRLYPLFLHYLSEFACEGSESQGYFLQNVANEVRKKGQGEKKTKDWKLLIKKSNFYAQAT